MNLNIFRQVYYEFRYQPVSSVVTVIGTALAIFLIMILVMTTNVTTMPMSPESGRDRMLHGKYIHFGMDDGDMSSNMSYTGAKFLYDSLPGIEVTTFFNNTYLTDIGLPGQMNENFNVKHVGDNFFKVFDFTFIAGAPFSSDAIKGGLKEAVISEKVARSVFKTTDVIGKELYISQIPYKVVGLVKDVTPLATTAFSDIYVIVGYYEQNTVLEDANDFTGMTQAVMLMEPGADLKKIREAVAARKASVNAIVKDDKNTMLIDHGAPFTQAEVGSVTGSNGDSRYESVRITRFFIYAVLLLVPAINLSSMTQGRLRRRMTEIGVRRAFGCTRFGIIREIITESFIVTLIGGFIGLLLSVIFGYFYSSLIFSGQDNLEIDNVGLSVVINGPVFLMAVVMCFILNLLSSGLPAWKASRVNPVEAINQKI